MSRLLSFLISYIGATAIYWAFLRQEVYVFPNNLTAITADILGRQLAIMTEAVPIFWIILVLIYFTLRGQWVFMNKAD